MGVCVCECVGECLDTACPVSIDRITESRRQHEWVYLGGKGEERVGGRCSELVRERTNQARFQVTT